MINSSLTDEQHGFRKNKSIDTNIVLYYQYLVENVVQGY